MFNINNTPLTIWSTVVNRICMKCNVGEHNASIWKLHQGNISVSVMTNRKEKNSLLAFSRLHLPVLVFEAVSEHWQISFKQLPFLFKNYKPLLRHPKECLFFSHFQDVFLISIEKDHRFFISVSVATTISVKARQESVRKIKGYSNMQM